MGKLKFNKKSLKYGSYSLILIVIVLTIAVFVNLLVGMGDFKWDLTSNKIYSLSDDSKTILKDIKKDVTIYGLFDNREISSGDAYKDLINLLDEYSQLGIKVTYVDPTKDPGTIATLTKDKTIELAKGDFVVKCGDKVKKLNAADLYGQTDQQYGRVYNAEPLITGAIKFVTAEVTPMAYFVEGHGEYSLTTDMTQIKGELENNNFAVKTLSLMTQEKVPDDCKLLVFASPKSDLSESEKIKVDAYLKNNGKAVFLLGAVESNDKLTNFEELLSTYNIGINYDKVKETDGNKSLPDDPYTIIATIETNDINTVINGSGASVLLPDSRSLSILKNTKEGLTTTSLIKASEKAVADSILKQDSTEQGPFDLALASEVSGGSKVLAFGNGVFLTDSALKSQYAEYFSNGKTYFLSAVVNWTQDKTDETTISPKLISQKSMTTTATQTKVISVLLIGVLPILIMVCGLVVWSRRRHL